MNMTRFTRRLEECRKRWHHNTVRYVVAVARIVRAARRAVKDERRWGEWIRNETHMNRTTVYRYMRVAEFLKTNVDSKHQLVSMSIAKIYALSRLKPDHVRQLLKNRKAGRMSDVDFLRLVRRLEPGTPIRVIFPNLFKSVTAAMSRLERSIKRWQLSQVTMPLAFQAKLHTKLHTLIRSLDRIRKSSAAAM